MTLAQVLNLIVGALASAGAHHPSFGAVSHHLGWVLTHHWVIKVCELGTRGCSL